MSCVDETGEHEGWVAFTLADGTLSSGTSTGAGFYLDGYTYLPHDDNDTRTWGVIDPAYLRPWSDIDGWVPRCGCGWAGIPHLLWPDRDYGETREPDALAEGLLMDQWRLHLRDACPTPEEAR